MSKYYTTILNHRSACLQRVKDNISQLVFYGLTHDRYLGMLKELHQYNSWKRLPRTDKEYISGYSHAAIDHLYRFDIIWLHYTWKNGEKVFYETFDSLPREKVFYSGHFWIKSRKPFSLQEKSNILPKRG